MKTKVLFTAGLILIFYSELLSQWNSDPHLTTSICTDTFNQRYPQMISDGNGGAIIAWWDDRTTVYAQRIDAYGNALWGTDGIPICTLQTGMGVGTGAPPQKIISDDAGGAIIVWTDGRYDADIFAQHIDAAGNILWDSTGIPICTIMNTQQYDAELVGDGAGGAIIVWRDGRSDVTDADIYAQRIGGDGLVHWAENGVPVSVAPNYQLSPEIIEDGNGGAIITWTDYRDYATTGEDIYVQRIDSSGVVQWTSNGALVCNADGNQEYSVICKSLDGSSIIAWTDQRYSSSTGMDIYAQRINSSGTPQWTADGIGMCTSIRAQNSLDIVSDNSGGTFIVWEDSRVSPTYDDRDIYAQFVDASGTKYWGFYGIPVCTADDYQFKPRVIPDGEGGMFVVWEDRRPLDNENNDKVFMQHINNQGLPAWQENGIAVCKTNWAYPSPQFINDGMDGVIVVWEDYRTRENYDIYAQHIDKNTFPGKPYPSIISVTDVPDDNGGRVRLSWSASAVDAEGMSPQINSYGIWRKTEPVRNLQVPENAFNEFLPGDNLQTGYEIVATIPAIQASDYTTVINTIHDDVDETFLVTAHAENPNFYLASSSMSGYSSNNSVVEISTDLKELPQHSELFQNYPNPFSLVTHIEFRIAEFGYVSLKVYDVLGRETATLVNEEKPAGIHTVEFNAGSLTAGMYYYVFRTENFIRSKPLIVSR